MDKDQSAGGCRKCGNLASCTCEIAKKHKKDCRYRRAAELAIEFECTHGLKACPECDPCTCGAGEDKGVR